MFFGEILFKAKPNHAHINNSQFKACRVKNLVHVLGSILKNIYELQLTSLAADYYWRVLAEDLQAAFNQ